jgi:hypothetical protein
MAEFELGCARLTAMLGPCAHPDAVPIKLLLTGELVAWLCPACDTPLPAEWGPAGPPADLEEFREQLSSLLVSASSPGATAAPFPCGTGQEHEAAETARDDGQAQHGLNL